MNLTPLARVFTAGISMHVSCLLAADPTGTKSPKFGAWKGLTPGTYIIEKHTYRGVSYHPDGVQYQKVVLAAVGDSGAAKYQVYTSDATAGPWKEYTAHSDVAPRRPGEKVETMVLPDEDLVIAARSFHCAVTVTVRTSDWSKLTTKEWTEKDSGLPLRREGRGESQDNKGQPSSWSSSLVSTGLEKRTVGRETLECFVQEGRTSYSTREERWRTWATPNVPGHRVAIVLAQSKDAPPELEVELIEWGTDPALLAIMAETSPHFSGDRRNKQDQEHKESTDQMEKGAIANLASGDAAKMQSGMQAVSQWSDILAPSSKAAAVESLRKALDHSSIEVRRQAGQVLGKLGVKGLSPRLTEMLRQDPDGANQYLEALGMQADANALAAILPYQRDPNDIRRRFAVIALRFFKDAAARVAVEKALADPSSMVRLSAVESLEKIADPISVPALVPVLEDQNSTVVSATIRVIAALGDDSAAPPLLALLKQAGNDTRAQICFSIGKLRLKRPEIVGDALLPLLDDPSVEVQVGAIASLGVLREKRAVPGLLRLLEKPPVANPFFGVQPAMIATKALGQIGDPSAIPALVNLLDSATGAQGAMDALVEIGDPSAAKLLLEHYLRTALSDDTLRVRTKEIEALGKLGTAETRANLEMQLASSPPGHKKAIRDAILAIDQRQFADKPQQLPAK